MKIVEEDKTLRFKETKDKYAKEKMLNLQKNLTQKKR